MNNLTITGFVDGNAELHPSRKRVQIITDGSCLGNPGPGGWSCILRFGKHQKTLTGAAPATTNNRMELTAAIQALTALHEPCDVEIITDSQYVKNGVETWMAQWKSNGWKTSSRKPVANQDLWEQLDSLIHVHTTSWIWTKGHATNVDNNHCDALAKNAALLAQFNTLCNGLAHDAARNVFTDLGLNLA